MGCNRPVAGNPPLFLIPTYIGEKLFRKLFYLKNTKRDFSLLIETVFYDNPNKKVKIGCLWYIGNIGNILHIRFMPYVEGLG